MGSYLVVLQSLSPFQTERMGCKDNKVKTTNCLKMLSSVSTSRKFKIELANN